MTDRQRLDRSKRIGKAIAQYLCNRLCQLDYEVMRRFSKLAFLALPAILLFGGELAVAASGRLWSLQHAAWFENGIGIWGKNIRSSDPTLLLIIGACLMVSSVPLKRFFRSTREVSPASPDTVERDSASFRNSRAEADTRNDFMVDAAGSSENRLTAVQ